jgi:hypothetical protein
MYQGCSGATAAALPGEGAATAACFYRTGGNKSSLFKKKYVFLHDLR